MPVITDKLCNVSVNSFVAAKVTEAQHSDTPWLCTAASRTRRCLWTFLRCERCVLYSENIVKRSKRPCIYVHVWNRGKERRSRHLRTKSFNMQPGLEVQLFIPMWYKERQKNKRVFILYTVNTPVITNRMRLNCCQSWDSNQQPFSQKA